MRKWFYYKLLYLSMRIEKRYCRKLNVESVYSFAERMAWMASDLTMVSYQQRLILQSAGLLEVPDRSRMN